MHAFVLVHLVPVLASSHSSDSGPGLLLLAGPIAAIAIYGAIYRYYRNADKSDQFERETRIELKDQITGSEQQIDHIVGTRDRRIDGDNSGDYRRRVAKLD